MKNNLQKINELWIRCEKWAKVSISGYLVVGTIKVALCAVVFLLIFYGFFIVGPFRDKTNLSQESSDAINDTCTVTGINLHGTITTYIPEHAENDSYFDYDVTASEEVVWAIKNANEDEKIKAILVEVDSAGGYPVAGEEIANAIKNSGKPIVGFIRQTGSSAAYWALSSADKIFASRNSDVGSIGVTQSYLSNVEKNKKDGYLYEQLSAGTYKDSGSINKPLTAEEKTLFLRDINIVYENFVKDVSQNRKIPIEKVRSFADGSTVLGEKAKELGLVDEIGGMNEVERYLEETTGEKPEICWQ
ncbi:MAG: S49 family peptidase [bacterium]|nr:S49 family peptidase [bacterium]